MDRTAEYMALMDEIQGAAREKSRDEVCVPALLQAAVEGMDEVLQDAAGDYADAVRLGSTASGQQMGDAALTLRIAAIQFAAACFFAKQER